jgi:hypothetical protein
VQLIYFVLLMWDLSNKNHSQFNLIKIDTILYKYVCTNIDTRYNCGGIEEYTAECNSRCVADCTHGLIE